MRNDERRLSSRVYSRGILPEGCGARFLASTFGMTGRAAHLSSFCLHPSSRARVPTMRSYRAIAEYYDAEDEQLDILAHDVPFFLDHLPRRRRLSVLELAVGTARAAIPIAQAGHRVVGVDYDAQMIAIAKRKRDSVGIPEKNLKLLRQDALRLKLGEKFDWICIFFNTLVNFTT